MQLNRPNAGTMVHRSWTGTHKHLERLRCIARGRECSERAGTLLARTKLAEDTVERLLNALLTLFCKNTNNQLILLDLKMDIQMETVMFLPVSAEAKVFW